jgi:hypothetical protein
MHCLLGDGKRMAKELEEKAVRRHALYTGVISPRH